MRSYEQIQLYSGILVRAAFQAESEVCKAYKQDKLSTK